ncbi:hypothetical protein ACJEDR_06620 [Klebsiella pneumoniae]
MNVRFQREVVHGGIPWTRNLVFQIETIPTGQIASIAAGFCYGIKISAHSLLCSNVFDEEESKANCVTGGVVNVTDVDWLYFWIIMQAKNTGGIVIFRW